MKKLEYFLPRLLPWCASVPEPLAYQALIDSAIKFCEESLIVRYITDPITMIPDVGDYDLELPQFTDLARVLRVWYAKGPFDVPSGMPTNWLITDIGQITIFPMPHETREDPMFIEVATKPTRSAKVVADQLYNDWVEGVVGGAVARLCAMPDQPWSSDTNAAKGQGAYTLWRGKAQIEGTKGRVRRDTTVKMRPWA